MKKINYIGTIFLVCLMSSACNDFLDQPPLDRINTSDYWRTSNDLEKYVLKFYSDLPRHTGNSQASEDTESDNLIVGVQNAVLNGERTVTNGSWNSQWTPIRSVNIFFENYHKAEDDLSSYQQYLGEAHFFKAWFYFNLYTQYGDLPWYTSSMNVNDPELLKPRDPRTLVADSILLNIDRAIQYLSPRSSAGNARLNKEAALAFKTRVALFEGTWQKYHQGTPYATPGANPNRYFDICVKAAEELINGSYTKGIYGTGNAEADYYTLFGLDNMSSINEVLLYSASNSSQDLGNNVQNVVTAVTNGLSVTWNLVSSYLDKSGNIYDYNAVGAQFKGNDFLTKIAADVDPRLHGTVWIPGDLVVARNGARFNRPFINQGGGSLNATGFQVKKFSNPLSPAAGLAQVGGISETGYIIFRYAEVLLNYAEAKYELDNTVAYTQLNLLRQRVGLPGMVIHNQFDDPNRVDYGYPVSNELYEIRRERRVELALEGRRTEDYRRWAAHNIFKGKRFLGYPFKQSEFPSYRPPLSADGRIDYLRNRIPNGYGFRPEKDYLDDIPQVELTLNPNLFPNNPGWED